MAYNSSPRTEYHHQSITVETVDETKRKLNIESHGHTIVSSIHTKRRRINTLVILPMLLFAVDRDLSLLALFAHQTTALRRACFSRIRRS